MKHFLVRLGSDFTDEKKVYNLLLEAAKASGSLVCGTIKHEFDPCGFSAAVLLGESHMTIHTWPDKNFAFLDYFSCSEDPNFQDFLDVWIKAGFEVQGSEFVVR